jgi:DNA-binding transcriptional MerR regulator
MLKIGDLAKLGHVSVRMLRHYDDLDLLKPIIVDRFTGYRYYSIYQLRRLNRIVALKDLGFSLTQVAELINNTFSPQQLRAILEMKQLELQQHVEEEQARLAQVAARLRAIEQEGMLPAYDVVLKPVEACLAVAIRATLASVNQVPSLFDELNAHLAQHRLNRSQPNLILWHGGDEKTQTLDIEVAQPLHEAIPSTERVQAATLPALACAACVVHHGGYDTIDQAYATLYQWVEENRYWITGSTRQVHLHYDAQADAATFMTELQFPVEKQ